MTHTAWDVTVTVDLPLPDEGVLHELITVLPAGVSLGRSPWVNRLTIGLELFAANPTSAGALGAQLVEHALHALELADQPTIVGLEVLTPEETEQRSAGLDHPLELVSVTEAAQMLGITSAAMRARAQAGRHGAIKVGNAGWAFRRDVIEREATHPSTGPDDE